MSFPMTQLGGRAFNHSQSNEAEAEYDRLRGLARHEHDKRSECFEKSQQAYGRGDGAGAHQLSEEGKSHGLKMEQYNKQASDYIFRENNAESRVASDTIDLHGQFVEEAEEILEARIKYAQQHGQAHLHVIVGKGNHSTDHIQKLKPKVEQVCQELHLQYTTEDNAGRMYINLQGGAAIMPPLQGGNGAGYKPHQNGGQQQQQQQGGGGAGYGGGIGSWGNVGAYQGAQGGNGRPHGNGGQHGNGQAQGEDAKLLLRIVKKLEGCCVVM